LKLQKGSEDDRFVVNHLMKKLDDRSAHGDQSVYGAGGSRGGPL